VKKFDASIHGLKSLSPEAPGARSEWGGEGYCNSIPFSGRYFDPPMFKIQYVLNTTLDLDKMKSRI
jgi:hypothetical protein